jgi:uncharacterized protein YvpB
MINSEKRVRDKVTEILGSEHQCIQTNVEKDFFVMVVYYDSQNRRCKRFLISDTYPKSPRQAWKEAERYLGKYADKLARV